MTVWTRESITHQILTDVAGLWRHCEEEMDPLFQRDTDELMGAIKGGCLALLSGELIDTRDLLTLSVSMLHLIRELILEEQEKGQPS